MANPADDQFIIRATKELFLAAYDTTTTMNPNVVFDKEDSYSGLGYLYGATYDLPHLNIVNYDFNTVDTLAYDKNLLSFSNGFPHDVSGRSISPYLKKKVLLVGLSNSTINSNGIQIELDNWSVFENSSRKITSISVYNNGWQNGKVPFFSHSVQYDNHQAGPFSSGAVGFGLSFRTPGIKIFKVVVHFSNNTNDSAFYKANMVFTPTSTSQGNLAPTNSCSR